MQLEFLIPGRLGDETSNRRPGQAAGLVAGPDALLERVLDPLDVVHGAGVVPAAREPGPDAAPEHVRPAVSVGDLPDRLPVVQPGASVVEVAVVAGAQPGG